MTKKPKKEMTFLVGLRKNLGRLKTPSVKKDEYIIKIKLIKKGKKKQKRRKKK